MRIKKKNILFEQRVKSQMTIPSEVKQLHSLFTKNGFELYIVGGAVRDTLLGKTIKDYDLATNATPDDMVPMFNKVGIKNVPVEVGGKQAVVNIHMKDDYEIATFREDSKTGDGRRPDSVTFTDIATDVMRRDLTINALFFDMTTNEIVDLVGGMEDIKNGVIRTVGEADDRFNEDKLRILRAIRFAGRIGSKLDSGIDKSLRRDSSLEGISSERIRDEFVKGINSAKSVEYFLSLLNKYGLLDTIFKGMGPINKNFDNPFNDYIRVIAKLLRDVPYASINKALNGLKYSSWESQKIVFLVAYYQSFSENSFYALKKMHKKSGVSNNTFLGFVEEAGGDVGLARDFINHQLSITGEFVKEKYGMKDGPELGAKIKELETGLFFSR